MAGGCARRGTATTCRALLGPSGPVACPDICMSIPGMKSAVWKVFRCSSELAVKAISRTIWVLFLEVVWGGGRVERT